MKPVKKWIKIALDAVIFVLLVLMYRKQAVSMAFHEIGGLALIALFAVHHVFNGSWIVNVTRRLFCAQTPVKTRICYLLDALLLLAFLCIGVSGVLISKTVVALHLHGGAWKVLHYFCAALALLLVGVHVGLHGAYLFGSLRKRGWLVKIAASTVLIVMLGFGCYHLATTSYIRWLSMPFSAAAEMGGDGGQRRGGEWDTLNGQDMPEEGVGENEAGKGVQYGKQSDGANGKTGRARGQHDAGEEMGAHGDTFSLLQVLRVVFQFASISTVFAAITYGVEWLCRRKQKNMSHV